jgi:cytosine/adenosine deaminase-related metal-dependent hydrolase
MVGREIACLHLIEAADKPVTANRQILIADEHIAAVSPIPAGTAAAPVLAMPALVNAHDHGRAVRTSSLGASGKPLETWIQYQAMIPAVDPHLAAIVALSRTALGGVGAVQMHLTKPQGLTALPAEAATIARAAKDIGIRVGFAISMRDRNPFVYGPSEPILASLPPEARAVFEAMALRLPPKPRDFISLCD